MLATHMKEAKAQSCQGARPQSLQSPQELAKTSEPVNYMALKDIFILLLPHHHHILHIDDRFAHNIFPSTLHSVN